VADGFTSLPKEVVLRIFIAFTSFLAGFEPANFGSRGKHANHYTTEATWLCRIYSLEFSNFILFYFILFFIFYFFE
jgi:hypothetical protein